jgi:hypothetical protein
MLIEAGFVEVRLTPKDTSKDILASWVPGGNVDRFVSSYIIEAVKPR